MLDILKFIFQNFWHWLGFAILLSITVHGLGGIFSIRIKKNIINDGFDDEDHK